MQSGATALLEPIPRKPIAPKAAARFAARAFRPLLRFPTQTVRKPQAVVTLATIESPRAYEKRRAASDLRSRPVEKGSIARLGKSDLGSSASRSRSRLSRCLFRGTDLACRTHRCPTR